MADADGVVREVMSVPSEFYNCQCMSLACGIGLKGEFGRSMSNQGDTFVLVEF